MASSVKLYYVYDPMCSWCWGYKPTWTEIEKQLSEHLEIVYVVGGLAPDSDIPMPEEMQQQVASYWKKIEDYLGTEFNHQFWKNNTPRRSTYPACRATLAARKQGAEKAMLSAIQSAYYLETRNPSDNDTLISLSVEIGLDSKKFTDDLLSDGLNQELVAEIAFARSIGGNSFPSLFVRSNDNIIELPIDYQRSEETISQIMKACNTD
ncbi:DsbA family protein [Vibrio sp. DW001]|uniref:DsbA family protein n=1 Tax=Vibrio sp. DW001 TaxID=2912315 RepID=UPI0023B05D77|nr:DsbA family protein [Vibrio sp. DW001]WED29500.1 DsbA family protein [Vibrio sp. DW001]